ncbi:MAG: hypothetical protein LAT82_04105 [Nanoarchaeota archaeon]|nr:hypothetical protein [Nanoarchaeota archaeon]
MVQTTHFSLDDLKEGIQVWENNTEKLTAQVDFKAFYKELFTTLIQEDFIDGSERSDSDRDGFALKNENVEKYGILIGAGEDSVIEGFEGTRHNGFFEKRQRFVKYSTGDNYDFETTWHFRKKTPVLNWWFDFKMDIACRDYRNVEVVVNGQKKIMQQGLWEFRNKGFLLPSKKRYGQIVKITQSLEPFISQQRLENIMLNLIWFKKIMYDKEWCETKGCDYIYDVLNKHFRRVN